MDIKLNPEDFATLAICAIRYCHGRQTYMPSLVQGIIRPHLQELEDRDLSVMLQDCYGMKDFDFGDPMIDRPNWERWREDLKKEKRRRNVMSVIVKGMKIPETCLSCCICVDTHNGESVCNFTGDNIEQPEKRNKNCPLVEISEICGICRYGSRSDEYCKNCVYTDRKWGPWCEGEG